MSFSESTPLLPIARVSYGPLSLSEVLMHANKPCWVRARNIILAMFATIWVALLCAALSVAAAAPYKCAPKRCRILQSPAPGVRSELNYLSSLNVSAVWLSPVYKSPMKDFGYDISDFMDIDPTFGTLEDFKALVSDMKERGMRMIMDFVPNHSSDEHVWFKKSVAREEPYTDYYVWAKPRVGNHTKPQPPNNWLSVFGGSAWHYNEQRREFYLHQFVREQPDLNFRNPRVIKEMQSVLKFWLELGVSGFRVDATPHLLEDELLRDEPRSDDKTAREDEYAYLKHIYTQGLPGVYKILAEFRQTLDEFATQSDGEPRLLMAEVYDSIENVMKYYGEPDKPLADFPFNFFLISEIQSAPKASQLKELVLRWMQNLPEGACANWVLSNHDRIRMATRTGPRLVDAMNMVALMLPGVAVTYYGEEIGMQDVELTWEDTVDPAGLNAGPDRFEKHSRDPQRSPMQWDNTNNAGFSTSQKTWLPVHENHTSGVNVAEQQRGVSHLNMYRDLVRARDLPAVKQGDLNIQVIDDVFAFTRVFRDEGVLVAVNLGNEEIAVNLAVFTELPETALLFTCSVNFKNRENKTIETSALKLGPQDAVVLTFQALKVTQQSDSPHHELSNETSSEESEEDISSHKNNPLDKTDLLISNTRTK